LAASGSPLPDLLPGPAVFNHGADVIATKALEAWQRVKSEGAVHGFRNAQVVVIAPTGTISFMMGAETTGIEPAFSTLTFKRLAGNAGGGIMLALNYLGRAVSNLGYSPEETEAILKHLNTKGTIVGAPHIKADHVPVFATAVDPAGNSLPWKSHLHMIAAIQPFLSGSVSKTINMPRTATVQDIQDAYLLAYRLGLKNTALYRDGCKDAQPLNVANQAKVPAKPAEPAKLSKRTFKEIGDKEFPDLMWGYKRPIPADMPLSKKYRYTVGQDEVNLGLSFDRDWEGRFVLVETFITVDSASGKTRSMMANEGKRWSQLLRTGTKPAKIAREHINVEEGVGGGMVFGHPLIKTCKTIQDFVWKHIMLHIAGQTDFIPRDVLDEYKAWEQRPLFIHEEMAMATESSSQARKDRVITEFVDAAPVQVFVNEDELVCPGCSANGRLAIKVSGSCKTCNACGLSFGGC
jgi:ribonucleoside-diphosphate reductase alpha chain